VVCRGYDGSLSLTGSGTPGGKGGAGTGSGISQAVNESGEVKPRSLRFTWSMKTTSSRDPNEIMAEIKKVSDFRVSLGNAPILYFNKDKGARIYHLQCGKNIFYLIAKWL